MPIRIKLRKPKASWEARADDEEKKAYIRAGFSVSPKKQHNLWLVRRKKKPWELFEESVLFFAEDALALSNVNGGPLCKFGGHQVDACGGLEDTFIVFECKSKRELGAKSLRSALRLFWTKKREISRGIKKKFGKHRYRKTSFIVVLSQITPSAGDEAFARGHGITIWSESYFESIKSLYFSIGQRVRYYVLRELALEPPQIHNGRWKYIDVPAIESSDGRTALYSFFLKTKVLLDLAYVLRVESQQKRAYQRLLDRTRLTRIASYIEDGNSFKNSIVVALDSATKFLPHRKRKGARVGTSAGRLRLPKRYASMWVIDGQHRLYGYARTSERLLDSVLPVVGMRTRNRTDEAKTFVDINRNQKPVNPNLLWALFAILQPDEPEGMVSQLVKNLTVKRGGPFHEKVYVPGLSRHSRKNYRILHANFCDTISSQLTAGKTKGFPLLPRQTTVSAVEREKILRRAEISITKFFKALGRVAKRVRSYRWMRDFFLTNNGLNVAIRLLAQVLRHTNGKADYHTLLAPLLDFFRENAGEVDAIRRRTSSEGTRDQEAYRLVLAIRRKVPAFAEAYVSEHRSDQESDPGYPELRAIEESLRTVIRSELESLTPNWWQERIPRDVKEEAERRKQQHETPWPWEDARNLHYIYFLDFNDYVKVLCRGDNWREVFAPIFRDQGWISYKLRELDPVRKAIAHSRQLTNLQLKILELATEQLLSLLRPEDARTGAG